eukprot:SAG22_NODE_74_length_22289_cov_65.265119_19_plen_201_part_00
MRHCLSAVLPLSFHLRLCLSVRSRSTSAAELDGGGDVLGQQRHVRHAGRRPRHRRRRLLHRHCADDARQRLRRAGKALPFCCASTGILSKTVPFLAVCLPALRPTSKPGASRRSGARQSLTPSCKHPWRVHYCNCCLLTLPLHSYRSMLLQKRREEKRALQQTNSTARGDNSTLLLLWTAWYARIRTRRVEEKTDVATVT